MARTLSLVFGEVLSELHAAREQRQLDVQPRGHRGFTYAFLRAAMTVVQRDLLVAAVVGDICNGRPVVYSTFSGYDEVAHHPGIERVDALATLRGIDRQFARLEAALADAPRPTTCGAVGPRPVPGRDLPAALRHHARAVRQQQTEADHVEAAEMGDEGMLHLGAGATEVAEGKGMLSSLVRLVTRKKRVDGEVVVGPERRCASRTPARSCRRCR